MPYINHSDFHEYISSRITVELMIKIIIVMMMMMMMVMMIIIIIITIN